MFQESEYTEEQSMVAALAGQLAKEFDELYFIKTTKQSEYPEAFWSALAEGGYLGIITDEAQGGVGLGAADLVVFAHSFARAGLASLQLSNQLVCSDIVNRYGTDAQKDKFLPSILAGEHWAYADLENARGNSLFDIALTAKQQADGEFLLNGQKCFAVRADKASHFIVAARTKDVSATDKTQGISLFAIPKDLEGIEFSVPHINVRVTDVREEVAVTGDHFCTISFENVKLAPDYCLGNLNEAGTYLKSIASRQLLINAAINAGWGDRLIEKAVTYANDRVIFKDPISSYQAVQHPVVLAKTQVEMAKLLIERAATAFDNNESEEALLSYCSVAKYLACEASYAACDITTQAHGGAGYDRDTGIVGLWPLILISRLVPLSSQKILTRFAELVLELPNNDVEQSAVHATDFELSTEFEQQMLKDLRAVMDEANPEAGAATALGNAMAQLMGGKLAKYKDRVLSDLGGALPVKLDIFRLLALHSGEAVLEGSGVPAFIVKNSPVKYGLSAMAMAAISSGKGGRERIMSEFLPQMMQGKLFCYCITEPDAGTNTHKIKTVAKDMGDHFLLNGQKTYISAADTAHFMAVIARLEVEGDQQAVGTFVVKKDSPGISMTQLDIAALGDPQFTIYFEDVKLPKDALVGSKAATGDSGKGISEGVLYTLNLERIMVALTALQVGRESYSKAVNKAKEVSPFGEVLGESDTIKQRLAYLKLQLELNNLALKKATTAFDQKEDSKRVGMFANMSKYLSSVFADEAGQLALELYGIGGLDKDGDDIGGLCKLGRVLRTVPINNEMVLNFLAENLLGMPKSYRV